MVCHKCGIKVDENGLCPICDSGMLNKPDEEID